MTSIRQIESNRRNALKSTGPKSDNGKQRASKNAVRHGLTAETVIKLLEDPDDYRAFERSVTADYDPETAVERELVLRLTSLLWRLRRATSIETGLFQIEFEISREQQQPLQAEAAEGCEVVAIFQSTEHETDGLEMVRRFLRLADLDNGAFDGLAAIRLRCGARPGRQYLRWSDCDGLHPFPVIRAAKIDGGTTDPLLAIHKRTSLRS